MSYSNDPVRWTAHPDDAPDALRAPLEAAGREAPSQQQMKGLALKLAAVGVGTAAAAGAATAKAAAGTAAAGAKSAGVLTLTKVLASLAVVGAVGAGAVMMRRAPDAVRAPLPNVAAPRAEVSPAIEVEPAGQAPAVAPGLEPQTAEPARDTAEPSREAAEASRETAAPSRQTVESPRETAARETSAGGRHVAARERTAKRERTRAHQPAKHTLGVKVVEPAASIPSEVELLRQARAALAGRPREAFALTEQHRQHYAHGTFVQERDALAIEALLRAGELDMARDLARRFVRDYPDSPHAHRFREKMGL